jgi:mannosylfructose-phosphate synthase
MSNPSTNGSGPEELTEMKPSADRKRIMMISTHGYVAAEPELGKPDTGGQVVYILELSKCLARLGYDVDIFTRQFEDQPVEEQVGDRCRVVRVPCGGSEFIPKESLCEQIPEWVERVRKMIRTEGLEYQWINSHYWDAGLAGQSLANHLQIPHLHTPHSIGAWKRDNMDGDPAELEKTYNFRHRIKEEKVIYDECDGLIATTPEQRDILTSSEYDAPGEKIHVIPPGYDDTKFFPVSLASRAALKSDSGHNYRIVLALGRVARNKGYDLLIKSMVPVFERFEDAKLLLAIGSADPNEDERMQITELKELAGKLEFADRVIFLDYIEENELANFYRMADVFALSSRYEPFGMTAVEAMACGVPTVVTTEGGLWKMVNWGLEALYANPFDPPAFGHAICQILGQPRIAAQLSKFASQKARAQFTWMGIAQQLLRILESIGDQHQNETDSTDIRADESVNTPMDLALA